MKRAAIAMAVGIGILGGIPQVLPAAEDREERRESNQQLRDAIQKLQHARYELAMADRKFGGERADSLQQTQYAIEQLFAAIDDRRWQEEDRQLWQRHQRESEAAVKERRNVDMSSGEFRRAESALRDLRDARRLVDKVEGAGYGGHKSKALVHIDEAIKAMEKGIERAREQIERERDRD